jgi:hypothetical protein
MLIGKFGELVAATAAEKGERFRHDKLAITREGEIEEQ